jgi:solute carrier family 25 phosphate transporter 23/24/25/41
MFKGFLPNIVKNAPNKSIQLTMFDLLKRKIAESEKALLEEKEILKKETKGGKKKK